MCVCVFALLQGATLSALSKLPLRFEFLTRERLTTVLNLSWFLFRDGHDEGAYRISMRVCVGHVDDDSEATAEP